MGAIDIYYYTAWNGYSWQGCDGPTAASLQGYMEAAGVLPGTPGRAMQFGGAIACQLADRMGVAVYRCGVRQKGDAFGRDSFFIALAFVPLEAGPADFAAILTLPQMSPAGEGELSPVHVESAELSLPGSGRPEGPWRDEPFTLHFNGISGLREASWLFFAKSCQLGLLQATFASETSSVAGVDVEVSYRVFPEIATLADAARAYVDAKKLARGSLAHGHPASGKLMDAICELQSNRIGKMPGYAGLAEYLAWQDGKLGGFMASMPVRDHVGRDSRTCSGANGAKSSPDVRVRDAGGGRQKRAALWILTMLHVAVTVALAVWLVDLLATRAKLQSQVGKLERAVASGEATVKQNAAAWSGQRQSLEQEVRDLKLEYEQRTGEMHDRMEEDSREQRRKYEDAARRIEILLVEKRQWESKCAAESDKVQKLQEDVQNLTKKHSQECAKSDERIRLLQSVALSNQTEIVRLKKQNAAYSNQLAKASLGKAGTRQEMPVAPAGRKDPDSRGETESGKPK